MSTSAVDAQGCWGGGSTVHGRVRDVVPLAADAQGCGLAGRGRGAGDVVPLAPLAVTKVKMIVIWCLLLRRTQTITNASLIRIRTKQSKGSMRVQPILEETFLNFSSTKETHFPMYYLKLGL